MLSSGGVFLAYSGTLELDSRDWIYIPSNSRWLFDTSSAAESAPTFEVKVGWVHNIRKDKGRRGRRAVPFDLLADFCHCPFFRAAVTCTLLYVFFISSYESVDEERRRFTVARPNLCLHIFIFELNFEPSEQMLSSVHGNIPHVQTCFFICLLQWNSRPRGRFRSSEKSQNKLLTW